MQQCFHQRQNASDLDQLAHGIDTSRPHIGQYRYSFADPTEVVDAQRNVRGMGDGQQMQYGIGGAFQRDGQRDGVFECLAAQDIAGFDAQFDQVTYGCASVVAVLLLVLADGVLRRTAG